MAKHITTGKSQRHFDPHVFLSTIGKGREMLSFQKKTSIFAQGDATDGLFFIQKGQVRLSVVSEVGKKQPLPFWAKTISLEKVVWLVSFYGWRLQPLGPTASFCMSRKRRWCWQ